MSSSTTSFVSGRVTPAATNSNVQYLEAAETYEQAFSRASQIELADGRVVVIYRVSMIEDPLTVYLSRQLGDPSNGEEDHAPAKKGNVMLGYELYAAPSDLLSRSAPPSEPDLSVAVASVRKIAIDKENETRTPPPETKVKASSHIRTQMDPKPSGPNVVGPNPPPKLARPVGGQLDVKPSGPN
jgi:hypothetical protein